MTHVTSKKQNFLSFHFTAVELEAMAASKRTSIEGAHPVLLAGNDKSNTQPNVIHSPANDTSFDLGTEGNRGRMWLISVLFKVYMKLSIVPYIRGHRNEILSR